MEKSKLAEAVYKAAYLRGDFLLRSGKRSQEYFDKYQIESDPVLLREIARHMAPLIPEGTELLAGLEMGGIPVVSALSLETGIPAVFVRKKAKEYGTCRLAEGADVAGKRLCIIEDVITSGGQVLLSAADLRRAGARVSNVLCVINRSERANPLSEDGLELAALFTMETLKAAGSA